MAIRMGESADQPPAVMLLVEDGVRRIDGHTLPARGTAIVPETIDVSPALPSLAEPSDELRATAD